jgi:hypothetical protein
MMGKGKVRFNFCKEGVGKALASPMLDSRLAFAYTPEKFTFKVPKVPKVS